MTGHSSGRRVADQVSQALELALQPGPGRCERVRVGRLEHDLDLGPGRLEARIRADRTAGQRVGRLDEHAGRSSTRASGRAAARRRSAARAAELVGVAVEHRLHLARQAGQHPRRSRAGSPGRRRVGSRAARRPAAAPPSARRTPGRPGSARAGRRRAPARPPAGRRTRPRAPSRVMSSGVPPRPPVTIRWSTRDPLASDEVDDAVELVGHRRRSGRPSRRAARAAARARRRSCSRCPPRRARCRSSGWRRAHGEYDHPRGRRSAMPKASWRHPASSPTAMITPDAWQHRTARPGARAVERWVAEESGASSATPRVLNFFRKVDDRLPRLDVQLRIDAAARIRALRARRRPCAWHGATSLPPRSTRTSRRRFRPPPRVRRCVPRRIRCVDPRTVGERPRLRSICAVRTSTAARQIDVEATRDMPATSRSTSCRTRSGAARLEHPLFAPEGSFVAMVDGVARRVAAARRRQRACASMFTGTCASTAAEVSRSRRSSHRRAGRQGTGDATVHDQRRANAPMLAINRRLGFEPQAAASSTSRGNGFFASAASTCDVTHTGVVTYFAE